MGSRNDWFCWEIMQCKKSKQCPARKNPEKPCWEIAKSVEDDYRDYFNICQDCIVHVIKTDSSVLTNREIIEIMKTKTKCKLPHGPAKTRLHSKNVNSPPPG